MRSGGARGARLPGFLEARDTRRFDELAVIHGRELTYSSGMLKELNRSEKEYDVLLCD